MGYKYNYTCTNCQLTMEIDTDWVGMNMQCPQCGNVFTVQPPQIAQQGMPPQGMPQWNQMQQSSKQSNTALIMGILGLALSLLFTPVGLILSIIGLIIGCKNKHQIGIILSAVGLALSLLSVLFVAVLMLPAMSASRERARQANCISNLKQCGLAMLMYACDNRDYLPANTNLKNSSFRREYLPKDSGDRLRCPSSKKVYVYIGKGLVVGRDNPDTPIMLEKPDNHSEKINILFLDGHVASEQIPSSCQSVYSVTEYLLDKYDISGRNRNDVLENARNSKWQ